MARNNTYTRRLPHGVCGTYEFYTSTGKCVFCARKHSAAAKLRQDAHESADRPNVSVDLAAVWLRKPLTMAK